MDDLHSLGVIPITHVGFINVAKHATNARVFFSDQVIYFADKINVEYCHLYHSDTADLGLFWSEYWKQAAWCECSVCESVYRAWPGGRAVMCCL